MQSAPLPPFYLCRHGQTDWNAEGRIQGQRDIPLNRLGQSQARRNGRYLRNVLGTGAQDFRFVASPLSRAVETMPIIRTEIGLEPDDFPRDERLMELHYGDWQGRTLPEIGADDATILERREADKWGFLPPGSHAEGYGDLAARIRPVFEALAGPAIVVAHGGVTRAVMHLYGGEETSPAAHMTVPQDRILHVSGDALAWV